MTRLIATASVLVIAIAGFGAAFWLQRRPADRNPIPCGDCQIRQPAYAPNVFRPTPARQQNVGFGRCPGDRITCP